MSEELEKQKIESEENSEPKSLQIKDQDTYKFYDYMKSHSAIFIAFVSAIITFVSFLSQYVFYLKEISILKIWNIPVANIEINSNVFFSVLQIIFFILIFNFVVLWSVLSINANLSRIKKYLILDEFVKHLKQLFESSGSKRDRDMNSVIKKYIMLKNKEKSCYKKYFKDVWCKIFKIDLLLFFLLLFLVFNNNINFVLINCLAITITNIFFYFRKRYHLKHEIREMISSLFENHEVVKVAQDIYEKIGHMNKSESTETKGFKELFSDDKIMMVMFSLLVSLIIWLTILNLSPIFVESIYQSTTFPIVTEDGKTYAVVYQTKDIYVLESATIEDCGIIIDTSKQRIVQSTDFAYEVKKFSYFMRINHEEGSWLEAKIKEVGKYVRIAEYRIQRILAR